MILNEFLEKLRRVYPKYNKAEDYVEVVLKSLVSNEKIHLDIIGINDTVLRKMASNTPNSRKHGKLSRKLAIRIADAYDPTEFINYIDGLEIAKKEILLDLFKKDINGMNLNNISKKLSTKLQCIIFDISMETYDMSKRESTTGDKLSSYDRLTRDKLSKKYLKKLIDNISCIDPDKITALRVTTTSIKRKFSRRENSLRNNIVPSIIMYFKYIDKLLSDKEKNSGLDSDNIRMIVRNKFIELDKKNYSKDKIYNLMINWMTHLLDADENSCKILLSYFIQSCEVFNVINKQDK